jgi:poly(hydroxyalkanoate) granule-associated protein
MARKSRRKGRAAPSVAGNPLAQSVVESAQQIWLAGLGAFSRARTEGDKMFQVLVERGKAMRGQARSAADQAYKTARAQADAAATQAAGKWDKLEQVFEERVSRSLNRLGVLTSKDVEALARQVEDLNGSVRALMGAKDRKAPARKRARKSR